MKSSPPPAAPSPLPSRPKPPSLERLLTVEEQVRLHAEMLNAVGQAVIATDLQGRVIFWNSAAERLFGWTAAEVLGEGARQIIPAEMDRYADEILARVRAGEQWSGEFTVRRKDGSVFQALVTDSALRDENGNISGIVGISTDLSAIKQVEERLRRSEALLAKSQRIARLGSWEWNVISDELTFSDEQCRLLGLDPGGEVTVATLSSAIHDEDRALVRQRSFEAMNSGATSMVYDFRVAQPDGSFRLLHCRGDIVRDADGRAVRVIGTNQDITERHAAQEALRQSEERLHLSQRLEAVGQLAGGVAHDFNNLLTAITSYTQLLLEDTASNDRRREDLLEIKKAADRATSLTRQLLAFSRKQVLDPQVLDVNLVVGELEKMLRRLIGEHVALVTDFAPSLAPVLADPGQLEQVIVNLAVNARDAMPDGGTLSIRTADVELTKADWRGHSEVEARPGRYVLLTVSDTGVGMDAANQARIFEPFFTTKGPGKGTGLGLSTVYGIVKQSEGYIWVSSRPDAGTTFRIYLPAVADGSAAESDATSAVATAPGEGGTILLVEDEDAVRALARRVLEREGYTVLEAANGVEGARVADTHDGRIDLLLTDMVMPSLSGRSLAERLRARRPTLPVLFMSGYPEGELERRDLTGDGTSYLEKPFSPQLLRESVRVAIEAGRA